MEKELKSIVDTLGTSTSTSYTNSYKRLRNLLEMKDKRRPIKKMSVDFIIDKIESVENPNTAHSVFVILKKLFPAETHKEKMDKLDDTIRKRKRELQIKKNGVLKETIPTYADVNTAVKNESNPKKYITSFLMLKVNTRNQDIALIDMHQDVTDESKLNKTRNHLILKEDNKVLFIRNKYKTVKKYGVKRNIITVKKFAKMVKEIIRDGDDIPLYSTKTGGHILAASVGSYIRKYVVLGLNEGVIMKIVLKHIDDRGSYSELRRVSNNRGTSISILLSEYDITNIALKPSEEIGQDQVVVRQEVKIETETDDEGEE